ncbi:MULTISPECIES: hypothetical protein [Hyphomicrobiales]|jgi:hypothetical protein|uniref:hypothetical protein n=1 Tax=Hyphomicrobiales TaxID=356 RepID=UPI001BCC63CC|nr:MULTISPECIES: hypothetical protein [Hyphomicrobiales]CAH1656747.1 conserved exported hypothetical protein [Hyphomicrobiales bacterium]MBS7740580.1 hypothetical protein [Chelatococcus sp. HY11]MBX3491293.1 hypothetical protein [Parvibaculum sp.]MBX3544636.1 hypothetical protein [Chelatococcus sp.]MCO5078177.1 hypothetical protein [Chelatococcus sp.]
MRLIIALAAGTTLALSPVAYAQAPSTQPPATQPPATSQQAPQEAPPIRSVRVLDIEELPEATRTEVNNAAAQRSPTELQQLRASIDATPAIKSALTSKGRTSAEVIVASLSNDGTLTLVTKKAS